MVENSALRKVIAANVHRLRRERRLSQRELGEKIGVTHAHISKIEAAISSPSAEVLYAIADTFGVSADALRQLPIGKSV